MGSVSETLSKPDEYKFKPYVFKERIPKSGQIPKGRSGHRIVSDISCMYSYGGFNPTVDDQEERTGGGNPDDLKLFREIWKFNIVRGEWKKLHSFSSSVPKQTASNAVLMKGSLLIVHGGTGIPFGYTNTHHTFVADLKRDSSLKRLRVSGTPPLPQYGQAMVLSGHHLYVVGGTTGHDYSADVHCLDLKTRVWEETYISKGLSNLEPQGRYRHEIALYNSRIIIFGGGTDSSVFNFEHLPAFNLETKQWEILSTSGDGTFDGSLDSPNFPPQRRCHASVQVPQEGMEDSKVVICGGYDGVQIFSDVWVLNLRTLEWKRHEDINVPLYFHSASLSPTGQMFVFGGICDRILVEGGDSYTIRTNNVYSAWVTIPKLKEICWDAFIYYNPDLLNHSLTEFLNNGVPKEFVERIEC